MELFSISFLLTALFLMYISYATHSIYTLFNPPLCENFGSSCLFPMIIRDKETGKWPLLQIRIYASLSVNPNQNYGRLIDKTAKLDIDEVVEKQVDVYIPQQTRNNGSLYFHCFLLSAEYAAENPFKSAWRVVKTTRMTTYRAPIAEKFKLIANTDDGVDRKQDRERSNEVLVMSHFRSTLALTIVAEAPIFDKTSIPGEIYSLLDLNPKENRINYRPLFHIDELNFRERDLVQIKPSNDTLKLNIRYRPLSIGKLRLLLHARYSIERMRELGFGDKDLDEMKGIFVDTNFYFLIITVTVSALHILLDTLAFKNDISFWMDRKTLVGLSTRTLKWRFFSEIIVFLYLMDEGTSLLVLVPTGIGAFIELWKIMKTMKVNVKFCWIPRISFGIRNKEELETESFDVEAMKYLAFLMMPLCIGGAIFSLFFIPHKSWYNWSIHCAANGVYAFGFLFMLPQLYLNYRLKSVAHLPWRAFMYKAFNTFIDDMFAFIINMPTSHRIACFRDDVVFIIYLYQRYLYPVDKSRMNEFGESFKEGYVKKND